MKRLLTALLCAVLLMGSVPALAEEEYPFIIYHGDRTQKRVAITIDDCYDIGNVRRAYELTKKHDVPITFFVLGIVMKKEDAQLWQSIAASRNEIGNHSYGHVRLRETSRSLLYTQIMRTQSELDQVLGYHYPIQVFRAPFGHTDKGGKQHINPMLRKLGYDHAIHWDVSETKFDKCRKLVQNGSILLFHTNAKDLLCLEQLIPWLLEEGYELVTVSELLGKEPVATSTDLYEFVQYGDWSKQREQEKKQGN